MGTERSLAGRGTRSVVAVMGLLLGVGALAACAASSANGAPPAASPAAAPADDDVSAGLMDHHRHHHHGGIALFLAMSLDTLGVAPEQQAAVEKVRADLQAKMEPSRVAEQKLIALLADGLDAGMVDAAAVDAAASRVTAAAGAVQDASSEAVGALHDLLTPPERAALVEKMDAHWAVWQEANADETRWAKPGAGHLAALATDLDLTAGQVDAIRASLAESMKDVARLEPQEIAVRMRAFGDAFRAEKLESNAWAAVGGANARLASWGAVQMGRFVESVSPVLTPEQRATFARRLREHAAHNPSAQADQ